MAIIYGTNSAVLTLRLKEHTSDDNTITLPYEGRFSALKQLKASAKRGQAWTEPQALARIGNDESLVVIDAVLDETGGGLGTLTITCSHLSAESSSSSTTTDTPNTTEWEIQNTEVQQPLAFHNDFPKDDASLEAWTLFLQSPATVQARKKYLVDPENKDSQEMSFPTDQALNPWAERYNKGIMTYPISLQVIVKRETFDRRPRGLSNDMYKVQNAPDAPDEFETFVSGLVGLKTGDTLTVNPKTGVYTRTQQWTYAHAWDLLLYPNSNTATT